jgi:hypothetical protein
MNISDKYRNIKKDAHLHSPAHVLADEISDQLSDKKHFGFYLKMALGYDHNYLRRLVGEVLEGKPKKPGALFAYLIKQGNSSRNAKNSKIT